MMNVDERARIGLVSVGGPRINRSKRLQADYACRCYADSRILCWPDSCLQNMCGVGVGKVSGKPGK